MTWQDILKSDEFNEKVRDALRIWYGDDEDALETLVPKDEKLTKDDLPNLIKDLEVAWKAHGDSSDAGRFKNRYGESLSARNMDRTLYSLRELKSWLPKGIKRCGNNYCKAEYPLRAAKCPKCGRKNPNYINPY